MTRAQEELLTDLYDVLLNLYTLREQAQRRGDWDHINLINKEIDRAEAQRRTIRGWESRGVLEGAIQMTKITNRERPQTRDDSIIDHVARELFDPKAAAPAKKEERRQSPTTSTGLPVEEQIRKEWDPRKGGLPTFCPLRRGPLRGPR